MVGEKNNSIEVNMIDKFTGEYRFLSNFYDAEVELDGIIYPRVENAYQAAKNFNNARRQMFKGLTASEAKKEGGNRKVNIRPDWNQVKNLIMENLVRQKFRNHIELKEKLLNTGDQELIEGNAWGDVYWGICDGVGENYLGKILMKVREELKNGSGL